MTTIKLNWGHYIAIFYTFFVVVLMTALIASFGVDRSLVVDDYYAKDLAYQSHFNKKDNQLNTNNVLKLKHDLTSEVIMLDFGTEAAASGTVTFYRPSDKSLDFTTSIDNNIMSINTADIAPGKWWIKVDWKVDGVAYYKEQEVFI